MAAEKVKSILNAEVLRNKSIIYIVLGRWPVIGAT